MLYKPVEYMKKCIVCVTVVMLIILCGCNKQKATDIVIDNSRYSQTTKADNPYKDQQSETNIYFPLLCNLTFFSICHNHKYSSVMAVPKKLMKMKTLPKRRISKSPRLFETITLEIQRHGTE